MSRNTDSTKLIVIDIEATAWDTKDTNFVQLNQEVIEFGWALLDSASMEIIENDSILVKPKLSKINEFCTNLTGITQKDVDERGIEFKQLCGIIYEKWRNYAWGSWGDFDRVHFDRQTIREGIKYPFNRTHYNIKHFYAFMDIRPTQIGLDTALKNEEMVMVGEHHRAKYDALNTARLMKYLCGADEE